MYCPDFCLLLDDESPLQAWQWEGTAEKGKNGLDVFVSVFL